MGRFQKDDRRPFGGKSFGNKRASFGRRNNERPAMFKAVCSECGDSCDIPFKPTNGRPVFCSNCFAKQGDRGGNRRERPRFDRFEDKQMHEAVCDKCGKKCEVPFRPTAGKPVFCNDCFEKPTDRGGNSGRGSAEVTEQIKQLNEKMDKLISLLTPKEIEKEVKTKKTKAVAKKATPKKKK